MAPSKNVFIAVALRQQSLQTHHYHWQGPEGTIVLMPSTEWECAGLRRTLLVAKL